MRRFASQLGSARQRNREKAHYLFIPLPETLAHRRKLSSDAFTGDPKPPPVPWGLGGANASGLIIIVSPLSPVVLQDVLGLDTTKSAAECDILAHATRLPNLLESGKVIWNNGSKSVVQRVSKSQSPLASYLLEIRPSCSCPIFRTSPPVIPSPQYPSAVRYPHQLAQSCAELSEPVHMEAVSNDFCLRSPLRGISPTYMKWIRTRLKDVHCVVLKRGDLHPRNIILLQDVDGEAIISGIIDWELCGWYPEYWEAVRALNTRGTDDDSDWWERLPDVIDGYTAVTMVSLIEQTVTGD